MTGTDPVNFCTNEWNGTGTGVNTGCSLYNSTGALLFIDWLHYLLCVDDHHGVVAITSNDSSGYIGCGQPGGDRGVEVEATLGDEDERGDTQDGEQEEKTRRDAPHPHAHPRHHDHLNAGVQLPGEERG